MMKSDSKIVGKKIDKVLYLQKKGFMLDEMLHRNTSKFAILLEYENPHSFFSFFTSCYFIFTLMVIHEGLVIILLRVYKTVTT